MKNRRSGNRLLDAMPHQPLAGPTLFGRADSAQSERQRMLHALERKKSRRAALRIPRSVSIATGLLGLIAIAGIMYSHALDRPATRSGPARPAPTQLAAAASARPAVAPIAEAAAARIETINEAPVVSPFANLGDSSASEAPVKSQAVTPPSVRQPAVTVPRKAEAQPPTARPKPARSVTPAPARAPEAKETVVKKAKDADVALLQALVKHVEAQPVKSAGEVPLVRGTTDVPTPKIAAAGEEAKKPCVGETCREKSCGDDDPSCVLAERAQLPPSATK